MTTPSPDISGKIDHIALSLSGGGVRAVGFHLGTMSMLDRLGLLKKVQILSTVSGGSLPGLGYALSQHLGRPFQDFFDDFFEFLPHLNVIEELLKRMTSKAPPSPSGRRDMIAAMANIYHTLYFNRFFGDYTEGEDLTFDLLLREPREGHLKEMIFNATEFKSGTAFRFQVSEYRCLIGNGKVSLCMKHAKQIRIADIMAASSCIPAGMEPMFFPDDFHWPDDERVKRNRVSRSRPTCDEIRSALARNTDTRQPNIALMDGGVYDNQGITSTLLALNRRKARITEADTHECGFSVSHRGDPASPQDWANWMSGKVVQGATHQTVTVSAEDLDLLIVSDTPVRKASFFPRIPFEDSDDRVPISRVGQPKSGFTKWLEEVSLGNLDVIGWIMMILLAASTSANLWDLLHSNSWQSDKGFLHDAGLVSLQIIIPLIVLVIVGWLLVKVKVSRTRTENLLQLIIPGWKKQPSKYLNKLRVGNLRNMVMLRFSSVSALTSTIYMNRIRGLSYSTAFSRPDLKDRILSNEIFTLQDAPLEDDSLHLELKERRAWPPPPEMKRIVDRAAAMATKLWIDHAEGDPLNDLDYLVVGGQCTMCYNLMRHLWDHCHEDGEFMHPDTADLFEHAASEWQKLVRDPLSLLNDRKRKSRLKELKEQAGPG